MQLAQSIPLGRSGESPRFDEFDDTRELIAIEPDSVLCADVDDDAGAFAEVLPPHVDLTQGAEEIEGELAGRRLG